MYLNNSATQIGHDDDVLEWLARVEKDDAPKDNKITVEIAVVQSSAMARLQIWMSEIPPDVPTIPKSDCFQL